MVFKKLKRVYRQKRVEQRKYKQIYKKEKKEARKRWIEKHAKKQAEREAEPLSYRVVKTGAKVLKGIGKAATKVAEAERKKPQGNREPILDLGEGPNIDAILFGERKPRKRRNRKGQMTIWGLMSFLMVIVAFSALLPVMQDQINNATSTLGPGAPSTILNLFILFMVISIAGGIFFYGRAEY